MQSIIAKGLGKGLGLGMGILLVCMASPAMPQPMEADENPREAGAMATPEAMPAATPPATPPGTLARATFTSAIAERKPVDEIDTLPHDQSQIFFFTDLRGFAGQTVLHRWEYKGQTMAEVPFAVRGPRWRVWSSKELEPIWTGDWRVSVVDESGRVIDSRGFRYLEAPSPADVSIQDEAPDSAPPGEPAR